MVSSAIDAEYLKIEPGERLRRDGERRFLSIVRSPLFSLLSIFHLPWHFRSQTDGLPTLAGKPVWLEHALKGRLHEQRLKRALPGNTCETRYARVRRYTPQTAQGQTDGRTPDERSPEHLDAWDPSETASSINRERCRRSVHG